MNLQRLIKLFGNFMILVYLTIGILLLFTSFFVDSIQPFPRIILGVLSILYAFFRSYRTYIDYKNFNEQDDK